MNKIDSNPCVCINVFTNFMTREVKEKDKHIKFRKINPCEGLGLAIGTSILLTTPYIFAEHSFLMREFLAAAGLFVDVISAKHIISRHLSIKSIQKEISPLTELLKKIETIEKTHYLLKNNIKESDLLITELFSVFTYGTVNKLD